MIYKSNGDHSTPLELHINGVLAAKASAGGDGVPRLISTSCFNSLRTASAVQNCTVAGEMRWINASSGSEGLANCSSTAGNQTICDFISGNDLYCTLDCPEYRAFTGTIHSLHLANDVPADSLSDQCAPCQPVSIFTSQFH